MIDHLLVVYEKNLDYARKLIADVADERMAYQPAPKMNHAAWIIGHLANTCDFALNKLDDEPLTPQWSELFGMNSQPIDDRSRYPSKAELSAALERGHEAVAKAIRSIDPARFEDPPPGQGLRRRFPKLGGFMIHVMIGHEQMHLGQLSAWRRVQGLPSV